MYLKCDISYSCYQWTSVKEIELSVYHQHGLHAIDDRNTEMIEAYQDMLSHSHMVIINNTRALSTHIEMLQKSQKQNTKLWMVDEYNVLSHLRAHLHVKPHLSFLKDLTINFNLF